MEGSEGTLSVGDAERLRKGTEVVAAGSLQELKAVKAPNGRNPIFSKTLAFSTAIEPALGLFGASAFGQIVKPPKRPTHSPCQSGLGNPKLAKDVGKSGATGKGVKRKRKEAVVKARPPALQTEGLLEVDVKIVDSRNEDSDGDQGLFQSELAGTKNGPAGSYESRKLELSCPESPTRSSSPQRPL